MGNAKYSHIGIGQLLNISGSYSYKDQIIIMDNLSSGKISSADIDRFSEKNLMRVDYSALLVCFEGHIRIAVNSMEVELSPSTLCVMISGPICNLLEVSPDFRCIIFASSRADVIKKRYDTHDVERLHHLITLQKISLAPKTLERVKHVYAGMIDALSCKPQNVLRLFNNWSDILVTYLFQESFEGGEENKAGRLKRCDEIFGTFLRIVVGHRNEHRDIEFYASEMCMSAKYLSKAVKEATGKAPSEWIRDIVVMEAKLLLRESGQTVKEVAYALNFPDVSQFCAYFKKATGITPLGYHKLYAFD